MAANMASATDTAVLRQAFGGTVLTPGHDGYDDARAIFNGMVDTHPAVIAQCTRVDDVAAALAFARDQGLEVAVRGGGHGVAGTGTTDGGIVIDLHRMNTVEVDPDARTVRVDGGATWGDVDAACQPHGLATTGGRDSQTGVAGLTLGGGSGWLERKFGMACDNLLSVELVTADGRQINASEDEHPELFWALHGGGGNFGIATALTFRLHPLPVTTFGLLLYSPDAAPVVVRGFRDLFEGGAPDELGGAVFYCTGPPEEFVPDHLVDRLCVMVIAVHAGPEAEARELLTPLLELGPDAQMVTEMPYDHIQHAMDATPGQRNYWSAEHLATFPDEAADAFCARAHDMVVPSESGHIIFPWGGAVARDADRWPVAGRDAPWCVHPLGSWPDPADDEQGITWAKGVRADMAPFAADGAYLNFTVDEGQARTVAGYGGAATYRRLAKVKAVYDPDNLFRRNHNIPPAIS